MSMTEEEKTKCAAIIHTHAVLAAGGNAVPVPGLGVAVDTVAMTTMAMALSAVFGGSITESVAKSLAISAIKQQALQQPVKVIAKELSKLLPGLGQLVAPTISVVILEAAGWILADELSSKRPPVELRDL